MSSNEITIDNQTGSNAYLRLKHDPEHRIKILPQAVHVGPLDPGTMGIFYLHYKNRKLLSPSIRFVPSETYTLRLQSIADKLTMTVNNNLMATNRKILAATSMPALNFYIIYIDQTAIKSFDLTATIGTDNYAFNTENVTTPWNLIVFKNAANAPMVITSLSYTLRNPACPQDMMGMAGVPNIPPNSMLRFTAEPNNPCNITTNVTPMAYQPYLIHFDTDNISSVSFNGAFGNETFNFNQNMSPHDDLMIINRNDPSIPLIIQNLTVGTPACGQLTYNGVITLPSSSVLYIMKDPNSCNITVLVQNLRS